MEAKRTSTRQIIQRLEAKQKSTKSLSELRAILDDSQKISSDLADFLSNAKIALNPVLETLTPRATLPLISAVLRGSVFVRLLLAAGADPNARGACGETAIYHAAILGDCASVNLLLKSGADPSMPYDSKGNTVLHRLARIRQQQFGQERGGDRAPFASFETYKKIVELLVEKNPALLYQANSNAQLPIDLAEGSMKKLLLDLYKRVGKQLKEAGFSGLTEQCSKSIDTQGFVLDLTTIVCEYAGPPPTKESVSSPPSPSI